MVSSPAPNTTPMMSKIMSDKEFANASRPKTILYLAKIGDSTNISSGSQTISRVRAMYGFMSQPKMMLVSR